MPDVFEKWEIGSNVATGISVSGLDNIKKELLRRNGEISGPILQKALYAAAKVFQKAIRSRTPSGPYGTGTARRNVIIYKRKRRTGRGRSFFTELASGQEAGTEAPEYLVGFAKKEAYYMYWYEYGTRISGRQKARPFFRKVVDSHQGEALKAAEQVVKSEIEK